MATFKLVDEKTGEELELPVDRKAWDGSLHTIVEFKVSRFIDNPGYVLTKFNEIYTPDTLGAKIVAVP